MLPAHFAMATTLNGSDSITAGLGVTASLGSLLGGSGSALNTSNVFTFSGSQTGTGHGSFSVIPGLTSATVSTLDLGNLAAFTFDIAGYGSFAAAPSVTIGGTTYSPSIITYSGSGSGTSESLTVYEVGTFTPTASSLGTTPTSMSATFTFNESSSSAISSNPGTISGSFSFASPANVPPPTSPVPEPFTAALLGSGLLMLGAVRYRRSH